MKAIQSIFTLLFLFCTLISYSQEGVIIEGHIKNPEAKYILLNYFPTLRGNLNFDGFKSIGSPVDAEGKFRLSSKYITHTAQYSLIHPGQALGLILFEGDSLYIDIPPVDSISSFVTGRGAGKINLLNLPQFQYQHFDLVQERSLEEFANYLENTIGDQQRLLEAIFSKESENPLILAASNKEDIQKIIHKSPLSSEEFEFLSMLMKFRHFDLLRHYLREEKTLSDSGPKTLDFQDPAFRQFQPAVYRQLKNVYDYRLFHALESITQIEFLKQLQSQKGVELTSENWKSPLRKEEYSQWQAEFIKQNFDEEVFNQYYAQLASFSMTLGYDYKEMFDYLKPEEKNKYVSRIHSYEQLLKTGLSNEVYQLNRDTRSLDQDKFEDLLKRYDNSPLFLVFWSAQFAGSSILGELPAIKSFEKEHADKMKVLYICVDKKANKNLWAARIIDESWKGEHYFLPQEGNDSTLNPFSDVPISSFCNGGATYSFIGKDGNIIRNLPSPFRLEKKEIEGWYE